MPAGRPREFDIDKAIERAMTLFWRKGYERTSLTDLTDAMGITRPSFYAAFGSKQGLFRKVLERYVDGPSRYVADSLEAPTARATAEQLLRGAIRVNTDERHPGCLLVQDVQAGGAKTEPVKRSLIAMLLAGERAIANRFRRARAEGDLPGDASPTDLARYIRSVVYGIAVQAAAGATARELHKVVDLTLRAWPDSKQPASRRTKRTHRT